MPASSFGAMSAWSVYLVASAALLLTLSPALASTSRDSREAVDLRNIEGVSALLSSLRPGIHVRFSFGSSGFGDPITFSGRVIMCSYGAGTLSLSAFTSLPSTVLSPGTAYELSVAGGEVEVAEIG